MDCGVATLLNRSSKVAKPQHTLRKSACTTQKLSHQTQLTANE
jgi:hypothetical protein